MAPIQFGQTAVTRKLLKPKNQLIEDEVFLTGVKLKQKFRKLNPAKSLPAKEFLLD